MGSAHALPSREALNLSFLYSKGDLFYRHTIGRGIAGEVVGTPTSRGYLRTKIGGKGYFVHRIIWKLLNGNEPLEIDHINGDSLDNRITNLRSVSRSVNMKNQKLRSDNKSGVPGIRQTKIGGWEVSVGTAYVGVYKTFTAACDARAEAMDAGYHPNHGREG